MDMHVYAYLQAHCFSSHMQVEMEELRQELQDSKAQLDVSKATIAKQETEHQLALEHTQAKMEELLQDSKAQLDVSKAAIAQQQTEHQLALETLTKKCQASEEEAGKNELV